MIEALGNLRADCEDEFASSAGSVDVLDAVAAVDADQAALAAFDKDRTALETGH